MGFPAEGCDELMVRIVGRHQKRDGKQLGQSLLELTPFN